MLNYSFLPKGFFQDWQMAYPSSSYRWATNSVRSHFVCVCIYNIYKTCLCMFYIEWEQYLTVKFGAHFVGFNFLPQYEGPFKKLSLINLGGEYVYQQSYLMTSEVTQH